MRRVIDSKTRGQSLVDSSRARAERKIGIPCCYQDSRRKMPFPAYTRRAENVYLE